MNRPRTLPAALLFVLAATAAPAGLVPGTVLDSTNAAEAEGLLPPEVLELYREDEWRNTIADWPEGEARWEKEFEEGSARNAGRLALDEKGGIVAKETGAQPPHVIGFPFPEIDPADPRAALRILWNYFYGSYNLGNSQVNVDLAWLSRSGLDRKANLDSWVLVYDGQKEKYRPAANPQNLLMQVLASVTAPQDLYGTTALTHRFRDSGKRDNVWMYVPALRRVREMSPANRSDGFLGSELTQDDGPFFDGKPEDFTWTLVGETEMFRLADPHSLRGETEVTPRDGGGWLGHYAGGPFVGFEDPAWKGVAWAPVAAVLARRRMWVIEGVPADRYYLYGKIQLVIDRETFQGAWNRKFSWTGELLSVYGVLGYRNREVTAPDGARELFWGSSIVWNGAVNLKKDRATVTGFPFGDRSRAANVIRLGLDPAFFDYQQLQRFGK